MARAKNKFIVGSIGEFVYRELNGKQIIQTKPAKGKVNITDTSMSAAVRMGKCSALAKYIRQSFQKVINGCYDGRMVNRLNAEISAIIGQCTVGNDISFGRYSFCSLSGFDFNTHSPIRENTGFSPAVKQAEGILTVSLPDIVIPEQLKFPAGASNCEITMSVSMIRLKDNYIAQYPLRQSLHAERNLRVLPAHDFTFVIPSGCLYILSMSLKYSSVKNNIGTVYNTKLFNPVGILDAGQTDGVYVEGSGIAWLEMSGVDFFR